ncbi:MAG: hypothetical protein A3G20_04270 [Acidobacteria bacterium RIFCSPLOWO2_12_FULL_59_11]|nr:MAG: hypothetical protein A3G20_04270 [Acidobacteria bacterium RIFCSPLOWO2_12_FULL_59_11]
MVDAKMVETWLAEITERIRSNTAEVARLQDEIAADSRRQSALKALLAAAANGSPPPQEVATTGPNPVGSAARTSIHPIEQGAIDILAASGQPLHISDLRAELARRGIPIPGKGTDANVIVYLARSTEVCRVGRGLYALRAWRVPEVPRRRRRTVRKSRKARK